MKGILEAGDIQAIVRGEFLWGARGEVPITPETCPSVWVIDDGDYERAMEVIKDFRSEGRNGVFPDRKTIGDRSYPFATEVFVAYLSDLPQDSVTASIRDWLLSPEGQSVVSESGYASITRSDE